MVRNLNRSMAKAKARKEAALAEYILNEYGPETSIADLHPDVRYLFAVCFTLADAMGAGDNEATAAAISRIIAVVSRYNGQKDSIDSDDAA